MNGFLKEAIVELEKMGITGEIEANEDYYTEILEDSEIGEEVFNTVEKAVFNYNIEHGGI